VNVDLVDYFFGLQLNLEPVVEVGAAVRLRALEQRPRLLLRAEAYGDGVELLLLSVLRVPAKKLLQVGGASGHHIGELKELRD